MTINGNYWKQVNQHSMSPIRDISYDLFFQCLADKICVTILTNFMS